MSALASKQRAIAFSQAAAGPAGPELACAGLPRSRQRLAADSHGNGLARGAGRPAHLQRGDVLQGLSALGHTDKTPRAERTTTDNKAFPATLESMTVASWPLHPGLTSKSMVSQPDDAAMMTRLLPDLTSKANEALTAAGLISRRFRIRTSSSRSFSAWSGSGRRPSRRMCSGPAYGRRR